MIKEMKEPVSEPQEHEAQEQPASLGDVLKTAASLAEEENPVETKPAKTSQPSLPKEVPAHPIQDASEATKEAVQTTSSDEKTDQSKKAEELSLAQEHDALQESYSKMETSLTETRKWGRELSQKLKKFAAQIEAYKQDGVLTPEEAEHLISKAQHTEDAVEDTPLMRYSKIWDQELDNIRKYSPEPDLDQHVLAFQHLLKNATPQELQDLLEDFALEEDPIKLTRLMLEKGKDYHQEIYKDLSETGSLKGYKKSQEAKLQKQQKEIEKLQKEIARFKQDQDYIGSSKYSLPSGGQSHAPEQDMTLNHLLGEAKSGRLLSK